MPLGMQYRVSSGTFVFRCRDSETAPFQIQKMHSGSPNDVICFLNVS